MLQRPATQHPRGGGQRAAHLHQAPRGQAPGVQPRLAGAPQEQGAAAAQHQGQGQHPAHRQTKEYVPQEEFPVQRASDEILLETGGHSTIKGHRTMPRRIQLYLHL